MLAALKGLTNVNHYSEESLPVQPWDRGGSQTALKLIPWKMS